MSTLTHTKESQGNSPAGTDGKFTRLTDVLRSLGSVVIAYSGGVDSSLLVKAACDALKGDGMKLLAVTARSSTYPGSEFNEALEIVRHIGAPHRVIVSEELDIPGFADNPPCARRGRPHGTFRR